jgi:hypothetical protein
MGVVEERGGLLFSLGGRRSIGIHLIDADESAGYMLRIASWTSRLAICLAFFPTLFDGRLDGLLPNDVDEAQLQVAFHC